SPMSFQQLKIVKALHMPLSDGAYQALNLLKKDRHCTNDACNMSHPNQIRAVISELKSVLPTSCIVIRDCKTQQVPEEELVTGDLVIITAGAIIPADIRILQSNGLKIETSAVTGDKEAYDYTHEAVATYLSIFEARNVAFKGSFCLEGDGIGIVIRTGKYTVLGYIINIHQQVSKTRSKLKMEIDGFVNFISVVALVMAIVFFLFGSIINKDFKC
ncbi:unnamed protein product, partial [Onchocerca ochengi]